MTSLLRLITYAVLLGLLTGLAAPRSAVDDIPADNQSAVPVALGEDGQSSGNLPRLTGASQFVSRPVVSHPADRTSGAVPHGDAPLAARRISGTATWCAPTPTRCRRWGGTAMLAAVPSFRYGDEPYTVQVTGFWDGKANAVLVTVVSHCDCGSRTVIDLSPFAYKQLAPLSIGRIPVVVDGVLEPVPTAPTTSIGGSHD